MRARFWSVPAGALVFVTTSACRIEVVDPDPNTPETVLTATIDDARPGRRLVEAFLHAGAGPDGRSRPIPDPSLLLGGVRLEPDSLIGSDGILLLAWEGDLTRPDGSMEIAPPLVDSRTPGPLTVGTRHAVAPSGGHRTGQDLELLAVSTGEDSPQPLATTWQLEIEGFSDDARERTEVRTGGLLLETIHVPAAWLPRATDSLRVTLHHSRAYAWTSEDAEYRAAVAYRETLVWTIRVDQPPAGRTDVSSR